MELALQHYVNMRLWTMCMGRNCAYATSKMRKEQREAVYALKQKQKQAVINGVAITLLLGALVSMLGGLFYFILKAKGNDVIGLPV